MVTFYYKFWQFQKIFGSNRQITETSTNVTAVRLPPTPPPPYSQVKNQSPSFPPPPTYEEASINDHSPCTTTPVQQVHSNNNSKV